ncbi:MAG: hypothetical protein CL927_20895 [Deltaproteobacteria bacterium]|nr:hypothetical protein [Deltaproteobacteria bacterium]HCH64380.1 hypothetical protein [Deltaproteobacteria bacterium]
MSSIDRLTNLARGVLADGQKQFEDNGGLEGAARRVGERVRAVAESTRSAVNQGLTAPAASDDPPLLDPALAAARREVAELKDSSVARASSAAAASVRAPQSGLASELARLDERLRSGMLSQGEWEAERSRLLDAHDRSTARSTPRRRTL